MVSIDSTLETRSYEMLSRSNEMLSRSYEMLSRKDKKEEI